MKEIQRITMNSKLHDQEISIETEMISAKKTTIFKPGFSRLPFRPVLTSLLAVVMAFSLAACQGDGSEESGTYAVHKAEDVILDETIGNLSDNTGSSGQAGEISETVTIKADPYGSFTSASISLSGDDMEESVQPDDIPFAVEISYYLDDEPITAEELAGKSGKLKIRIDYKNKPDMAVSVNGEEQSTIVPFVFAHMIDLPSERFSNIEVEGGGVTELSDEQIVYGVAMPGVEEILGLDSVRDELEAVGGKLDEESDDNDDASGSGSAESNDGEDKKPLFADHIEITADTVNCKIETNIAIAANGLLKELENEDIDKLSDAVGGLWDFGGIGGELADGVRELHDGAEEFGDGLDSYAEAAGSLADGAYQLSQGAGAIDSQGQNLKDGAAQLSGGLSALQEQLSQLAGSVPAGSDLATAAAQLAAAAAQLQAGASQLSEGINAYTGAVTQLSSGASQLSSGASQLSDYGWELTDGYGKLLDGIGELQDGVIEIRDKVFWNISSLSEHSLPIAITSLRAMKEADESFTSWNVPEGSSADSVRFIVECGKIG